MKPDIALELESEAEECEGEGKVYLPDLLRRAADRITELQAWHDAVMGQEFWYWEAADESFNVIIRPQPLAKE